MGQPEQKTRRRWPWFVVGTVIVVGTLRATVLAPRDVNIIISHDTTRINDPPVNPDSTIDYVAWLDEQSGRGATRDNNAMIPLIRAIGPQRTVSSGMKDAIFRLLDMPPIPEGSIFFVEFKEFMELRGKIDGDEKYKEFDESPLLAGPWTQKERPAAAAWLETNTEPLELVTAASARSHFYYPRVCLDQEAVLLMAASTPPVQALIHVSRALVARSMKRLGDKDLDGTWGDLMAGYRLARLIGKGPTMVERLAATKIQTACNQAVCAFAAGGGLTAGRARACLADLDSLAPLPDMVECIDVDERLSNLDAVMHLKRQVADGHLVVSGVSEHLVSVFGETIVDWNRMLRNYNAHFDRWVSALRLPHPRRREAVIRIGDSISKPVNNTHFTSLRVLVEVFGSPCRVRYTDAFSDSLLGLLPSIYGRPAEVHDRSTMQFELTRLAMALAAYKAQNEAFPAGLFELKGKYLPEIPSDIFSCGPLIYRRTDKGYLLYSVGEDMKDEGGAEPGDIAVKSE